HVIYGGDTGHSHTRSLEVAVNLASAFSHPGLSFLQDPRSSGQLCSARGPSEVNCPSLVRGGHEFCYFACFYCWGSYWRNPLVNTRRTCKLHTHRPGRRPH